MEEDNARRRGSLGRRRDIDDDAAAADVATCNAEGDVNAIGVQVIVVMEGRTL